MNDRVLLVNSLFIQLVATFMVMVASVAVTIMIRAVQMHRIMIRRLVLCENSRHMLRVRNVDSALLEGDVFVG